MNQKKRRTKISISWWTIKRLSRSRQYHNHHHRRHIFPSPENEEKDYEESLLQRLDFEENGVPSIISPCFIWASKTHYLQKIPHGKAQLRLNFLCRWIYRCHHIPPQSLCFDFDFFSSSSVSWQSFVDWVLILSYLRNKSLKIFNLRVNKREREKKHYNDEDKDSRRWRRHEEFGLQMYVMAILYLNIKGNGVRWYGMGEMGNGFGVLA